MISLKRLKPEWWHSIAVYGTLLGIIIPGAHGVLFLGMILLHPLALCIFAGMSCIGAGLAIGQMTTLKRIGLSVGSFCTFILAFLVVFVSPSPMLTAATSAASLFASAMHLYVVWFGGRNQPSS